MAGKSVTSAGSSSSGAVVEHGIRAGGDGEAQGSRGGGWRRMRMWGLGCWGALERTWEDMRGKIWGRIGRKVGVSGMGVSRQKG